MKFSPIVFTLMLSSSLESCSDAFEELMNQRQTSAETAQVVAEDKRHQSEAAPSDLLLGTMERLEQH
ncbi:hypothetical protein [Pseudoalteromonas phenolica]|uniref:Uncharacterized protein n=1 Tax=Pseudoalteromonas phenolica TaxID=161398 RepID=A0A0S2JY54_9GAMM|nr:hypothetical protein [Pseudoalteromonas phenolica]ALO40690.1 hypothetical protein PP2015_162 [Pseudoalteromonas phenolica]MBE0354795.1 hypothetical protein [Pseudoalteromonas phenolica O-BC30]RXE93487.1 hypothetical protein D9981_20465 [Pseudoalteromonas phenolica O-BC30]TMO54875.1 hypothetical protein CWC21_13230 [Pseudoalteromonas phenolica]